MLVDRARLVVRRQIAVQLQRAVSFDQHSGFLAALAHHLDDVPARLRIQSARQHPHPAPAFFSGAVFLRHGADDGAVRPVARRKLDLRAVGDLAWLRARALFSLAPLWSKTALTAGMGADGDVRALDWCDLSGRDAGCRLAYFCGPCHSAQSGTRAAPGADLHRPDGGLRAAGKPGHHRAVDAPAETLARRPGWRQPAGSAGRTWRTQRQWVCLLLLLIFRPNGAAVWWPVSAR